MFIYSNVQGGASSGRGRGAVPVNIRPTHYVSLLSVYFRVLFCFIKVNVQQVGLQGGVPNVRPAANVSGSVKILVYLLVCNFVCERLIN